MKGNGARWTAVTVAMALLATSLPAHAFRCGTRVISRGDHASKLLHYCGEPDAVQSRLAQRSLVADSRRIFIPGFVEDVWIEEWTYNLGPNKLMRVVRVENGVVADIRHLGYGYSQR
ncbi:MAG TPA: DUF2845 domain-containing protein [Gammaproteobacteria bacterium]|nr:DUF2845 domain-containing protein [Gammaproteobacteria bacterium]